MRELRGGHRNSGLRIRGPRFTDSTGKWREDGQDGRTGCLPENSTERWIRRRDSTWRTAGTPGTGECWSSCCRS